jgi:hypothetical protein
MEKRKMSYPIFMCSKISSIYTDQFNVKWNLQKV